MWSSAARPSYRFSNCCRGWRWTDWPGLRLIASSPMLGDLKPLLSSTAERVLQRSVTSDLKRYQHAELQQRVELALQLPA